MMGSMLPPRRTQSAPRIVRKYESGRVKISVLRTTHHEKFISLMVTRLDGKPDRPQRFYFSFRPEEFEPFVNVLVNALVKLPSITQGNTHEEVI